MKLSLVSRFALLGTLALGCGALTFDLQAQSAARPSLRVLQGSVFHLERILLPPDAKLHVSLVGSVSNAPYLPLATRIFPAKSGETRFSLPVIGSLPPGPYRVQTWIVSGGRVLMVARDAQTTIPNLSAKPRIRLRMAGANSVSNQPVIESPMPMLAVLKGTATKLDRRALSPDATLKITVEDQSLADAKAVEIASRTLALEGKQVPVEFSIPVNVTRIKPQMRVGLRVQIFEGEKLRYASVEHIPVTRENVEGPFHITLMNVVSHR